MQAWFTACWSSLSCRRRSDWARPTSSSWLQLRTPGCEGWPVYWTIHWRSGARLSRHSNNFSSCSSSSTTRMLALLWAALYCSPARLEVV